MSAKTLGSAAPVLIWSGYGLVALIAAAVRLLSSSRQFDIGQVMGSVMLMGGLGVGAAAAMFAGALLGTSALLATERPRRVGLVLTTAVGWIGFAVLAWILWGFWTN